MRKHYIELPNGGQFIIEADCAVEAIARLWASRLTPLLKLSKEELNRVHWRPLGFELQYRVHVGESAAATVVRSAPACLLLSDEMQTLLLQGCKQLFSAKVLERFVLEAVGLR